MSDVPIYICRTETAEGTKDYVTVLPPAFTTKHGLIAEAIVGMLTQPLALEKPEIVPDAFARNGVFVDFMQEVIAQEGPGHPGLQAEATRLGNGWVYVIDQRAGLDEKVQPEDVFGAFQAKDGRIVPESYSPNPGHRILSDRGFFELEPVLRERLVRQLIARSSK